MIVQPSEQTSKRLQACCSRYPAELVTLRCRYPAELVALRSRYSAELVTLSRRTDNIDSAAL